MESYLVCSLQVFVSVFILYTPPHTHTHGSSSHFLGTFSFQNSSNCLKDFNLYAVAAETS